VSTPPIADTPEALTPDWLTAALTGGGHLRDTSVVDVTLRPLGTGQMCDSVRVTPSYDPPGAGPATLVAKLPAADPTSRATAVAMRSYEKEVRFYQQLAPHLPVRTPAVYHADIEVASGSFVLLLEDMAPARQGDQLTGCTPAMAQVAVDELVRLHAPRWDDPALRELDWLHPDPDADRSASVALLAMLWDGFRERYAADLPAHVHQAGDVLFANMDAYLVPADDGRTIVHGDYRLDNLLFDATPGGTPVAVVDWQTCTVGPGAADVAYFVGAGLLEDDRRAVEADLVRRYHDALVAAGIAGYSFERFWRDYRHGTWAGLIMAVGASMMVQRTERGDRMFMAMASRHARHALDLDASDVLG
jgi:aminoglycoside/choline kinase family phosphotransferase